MNQLIIVDFQMAGLFVIKFQEPILEMLAMRALFKSYTQAKIIQLQPSSWRKCH